MPSYSIVCMPAHIHGRRELATSAPGKMWCGMLCCGEMSTYYGTWQQASKTWACKHHVSICAHTLVHNSTLNAEGKIQPFVCVGGFRHQCHHIHTQQEKVILLFKAHPRLTMKGLFSWPCICIFLSNKLRAPSCMEQTSAWDDSIVCRMTWREEQSTVCAPVVTEGFVGTKWLCYCAHTYPRAISNLTSSVYICIYVTHERHVNSGGVYCIPEKVSSVCQFLSCVAELGTTAGRTWSYFWSSLPLFSLWVQDCPSGLWTWPCCNGLYLEWCF